MQKNVLSLFDGISCGQIALERAGIPYDNYFASEIEPTSKEVTQKNYPNTIPLGDVLGVKGLTLPKIYLLLGGSPCQDFSISNTNGEGLNGEKSGLFWEFIRLLREIKPKYFLLENVVMLKYWENIITNVLGVEPIEIDSGLVSAQTRRRLYWTNIPISELPKNKYLSFEDIVFDNNYGIFSDHWQLRRIAKTKKIAHVKIDKNKRSYVQWDLNGQGNHSQQNRAYFLDGKTGTLTKGGCGLNICLDYNKDIYRKIHPIEAERLQTVPDDYTKIYIKNKLISNSKRFGMLGNGWTVDVISHILSFINYEK